TGKLSKSTSSYLYGDGRGWTSTTVYEYDASGNQTGSVTTSEQMKGDGTSPKRLDLVERFAGDVSAINPAEKTIRAALTLSGGDGEKNVLVEIRNALGATKTVSDAIILDTTAPVASFKINGGAETTTARDIQIDLSQIQDATSGIAGVKISTDDGATWTEVDWAALGADKVYSTKLSGDTGSKKVLVEVRDKAGLRSVESRTIQLESDATAPEVILPEGIHGSTVNEPTYRLHYTVDGIPQTRIFELVEGENQIQFTETDAAGNETVISFTVTLDTTPPVISLSQELDGSITNKSQMTVVYIVDGIEKTKTFELVEGENLLEIIETDSAGNSSVLAFTVIREPAVNPVLAQAIADELGIDPKDVKSVSVTEIEGRTYLEVTIATEEGEKRFIGVQVSEKEVRLFEVPSSDITVDALNALEKELGHPLESLKSLTFESLVVCLSTSCPAFAYKFEAAAEELGRTVIYRGQVIGPSVDDPDAATLILIQQIEVQFSEADNPTVESRIFDSEGRLIEVHFRDGAVMTISYDDPDYTYVIREGDRVVRAAKSVQFGKKDPDITDPNLRIIYADSNAFQFPGYENLTKEEMPLLAEAMHKIFSEFKDSELPDVLTSVSAKRDPQSILCVINLLCPPSNTLKLVSENKGTFTASFRETRYESPYHNRYEL
ncbi:MAG: hypothetical protein HY588_03840, partial [Candidatus Omnitrophica bacterium]|nr:hypothetical protein [Candidatus Omnitrophota bacterium]